MQRRVLFTRCGTTALLLPAMRLAGAAPALAAGGYQITVYYSPNELYHQTGRQTALRGLGTFFSGFLDKVQQEGNGLALDGRWLNWSEDGGFWIDSSAMGSNGPLRPFVTAANNAMPYGTQFRLTDVGRPVPESAVAGRLLSAVWEVGDRFEPSTGAADNWLDLYIGAEDGPDFEQSGWWITTTGAIVQVISSSTRSTSR